MYKIKVILVTFLTLFLVSCGARKVSKQTETIEVMGQTELTVADTTNVTTDTQHNTITIVDIDTEDVEITPLDPSKTMQVAGKEYKNAKISSKKKKVNKKVDNKDIVKENKSTGSQSRGISIDVKKAKIDIKSTAREEPIQFYLYTFLFILLLIVLYLARNKIKSLFV